MKKSHRYFGIAWIKIVQSPRKQHANFDHQNNLIPLTLHLSFVWSQVVGKLALRLFANNPGKETDSFYLVAIIRLK